jgi:uncharacterized OB-fold protein
VPDRPRPVPTDLTRGFWEAAARRVLAIQRCRDCAQWFHPPVPVCCRCHSEDLDFDAVSGLGTIHSYTVMAEALVPGFETDVPLVVAVVELYEQDGLVLVSNLIGFEGTDVPVGAHVEVAFEEPQDGEFMLPQFRLRDGAAA